VVIPVNVSSEESHFLLQTLEWLATTLKKSSAENRRSTINTSRNWRLRNRLPFLFQVFASDLWYFPFSHTGDSSYGLFVVWNIGSILIYGDIPRLTEYLKTFLDA
jgi:hypothetical protein